MLAERKVLLEDEFLTGAAWCRAHSNLVDAWLADLLAEAGAGHAEGLGLAAVGGYGRSELAPGSDIDVMLLHDGRPQMVERGDIDDYEFASWLPDGKAFVFTGRTAKSPMRIYRQSASGSPPAPIGPPDVRL